jgi:hypothetical protein
LLTSWATEYTVPPGTAVVIHFNNETPVELTHHGNGITFMSFGRHPDIWSEDSRPLEIFSDTMPRTPDVAVASAAASDKSSVGVAAAW